MKNRARPLYSDPHWGITKGLHRKLIIPEGYLHLYGSISINGNNMQVSGVPKGPLYLIASINCLFFLRPINIHERYQHGSKTSASFFFLSTTLYTIFSFQELNWVTSLLFSVKLWIFHKHCAYLLNSGGSISICISSCPHRTIRYYHDLQHAKPRQISGLIQTPLDLFNFHCFQKR